MAGQSNDILTELQKRFCRELVKRPDSPTKAYQAAGGTGKYCAEMARRLMKRDYIQRRIMNLQKHEGTDDDSLDAKAVADAQEIKKVLTSGLRGELFDEVELVDPVTEAVAKRRTPLDRIRCADILNKMQGNYAPTTLRIGKEDVDAQIERELARLAGSG